MTCRFGIALRCGQVFYGGLFHAVDIASLERQEAGRIIRDDTPDNLVCCGGPPQ